MLHLAVMLLQVSGAAPASGDALVAAMHQRWAGKWATSRTFVQRTVNPGRPDQTWYESEATGKLRIDVAPVDSMNATVMRDDSAWTFRHGVLAGKPRPYANALGILLVDVYTQPVAPTVAKLKAAGYDMTKIRADSWEGKPVWVVGAEKGDSTVPQFWVDQKDLLLVRVYDRLGPNALFEGRVTDRMPGKIPVESAMVFFQRGQEFQREFYNEIHLNVPLEAAVFDNTTYHLPAWIAAIRKP